MQTEEQQQQQQQQQQPRCKPKRARKATTTTTKPEPQQQQQQPTTTSNPDETDDEVSAIVGEQDEALKKTLVQVLQKQERKRKRAAEKQQQEQQQQQQPQTTTTSGNVVSSGGGTKLSVRLETTAGFDVSKPVTRPSKDHAPTLILTSPTQVTLKSGTCVIHSLGYRMIPPRGVTYQFWDWEPLLCDGVTTRMAFSLGDTDTKLLMMNSGPRDIVIRRGDPIGHLVFSRYCRDIVCV